MAAFSAIIHFHMTDQYLVNRARWLDHYLITIKQSVSFRGRMHPENFQLTNSKWPTISIIYLDRPDIR